jgi:hypothetical protein
MDLGPHGAAVLARLHVPPGAALSDALHALLDEAAAAFDRAAAPAAVYEELPFAEFEQVYAAGRHEARTPLASIARRAGALALFAGTLGRELDVAIASSFRCGNAALGCVLDACASVAAERLADLMAARFHAGVAGRNSAWRVLPYSPGYCGWHVSGQMPLFERLQPQDIGVTLNASAMMTPLKSVSGVLVAATAEAHRFSPNFPFCETCAARECLDRMRALRTMA